MTGRTEERQQRTGSFQHRWSDGQVEEHLDKGAMDKEISFTLQEVNQSSWASRRIILMPGRRPEQLGNLQQTPVDMSRYTRPEPLPRFCTHLAFLHHGVLTNTYAPTFIHTDTGTWPHAFMCTRASVHTHTTYTMPLHTSHTCTPCM